MPATANLGSYADCYPLLDAAVKEGGVRLSLPTLRKAIALRHRVYRARKLLLKNNAQEQRAGLPSTPYDSVYLQIEQSSRIIGVGEKGEPEAPAALLFRIREAEMLPALTRLNGDPIEEQLSDDADFLRGLETIRGLRLE